MKRVVWRWIGVEPVGCTFLRWDPFFIFLTFVSDLTFSDSRAVIMVAAKTTKGKAAAKGTCIVVYVHF